MNLQQHTIDVGVQASSATTYTGAGATVLFGLTLNDIGVVVGITVAVLGLIVNIVFKYLDYRLSKQNLNRRRQKLR